MEVQGFSYSNRDDDLVALIANKIEEGAFDPAIKKLVFKIVRDAGCAPKDYMCEVRAIYKWIKKNIRYFHDPKGVDAYHSARAIAYELKGGDCDDFAILAGAMFGSIGYPIKLRIIAKTKDSPFVHIYPLIGVPPTRPEKWIPLEFTDPRIPFGHEFPYAKKRDFLVVFEPKDVARAVEKFKNMNCRC